MIHTIKNKLIYLKNLFKINEENLFKKNPKLFWDKIAVKIHNDYGHGKHDYNIVKNLLERVNAKKVLDFGCGSGRFFPLYIEKKIPEIAGLDISKKSIEIASKNYPNKNIKTYAMSIYDINFPENHFDFTNCTRILQHINKEEINKVVEILCKISSNIYVNEMSETDKKQVFFIYQHDYEKLFRKNSFIAIESGMIGNQKYFLFAKE